VVVARTGDDDQERVSLRWSLVDLTDRERARERDALEEQAIHQDAFLATLGHELRNPLAALSLAAGVLAEDTDLRDVKRARLSVSVISRHAQQLSRLASDLLDVARVRHGKIDLQRTRVELSEIVTNAVEVVRPNLAAKQQLLEVRTDAGSLWVD